MPPGGIGIIGSVPGVGTGDDGTNGIGGNLLGTAGTIGGLGRAGTIGALGTDGNGSGAGVATGGGVGVATGGAVGVTTGGGIRVTTGGVGTGIGISGTGGVTGATGRVRGGSPVPGNAGVVALPEKVGVVALPGNGRGIVFAVPAPGGGRTGGGIAGPGFALFVAFADVFVAESGVGGVAGFFFPKIRLSKLGRSSGSCVDVAVVAAAAAAGDFDAVPSTSFLSAGVGGIGSFADGSSGSYGRDFAFGGPESVLFGIVLSPAVGGTSPGRSTREKTSPLLASFTSERYEPSGCFSDLRTLT